MMNNVLKRTDVLEAAEDLRRRTLASITRPLDRLDLSGLHARLQHRPLLSRRIGRRASRKRWFARRWRIATGKLFSELVGASLEELGGANGQLHGFHAHHPGRFCCRVEKAGALSGGGSCGYRCADRGFPVFKLQDRFGNFGGASAYSVAGGTSRMATPVTCPIISASEG